MEPAKNKRAVGMDREAEISLVRDLEAAGEAPRLRIIKHRIAEIPSRRSNRDAHFAVMQPL